MGSLIVVTLALAVPPASAAVADEGPFTSQTLFAAGDAGRHTYRIPALAVTTRGTLLAFCEGRRGSSSDAGDIDLVMRRSTDGGRTWSEMQVVWSDGGNTCGNPCPVVDRGTGDIWLLTTWNLGDDHEAQIVEQAARDTRRVFALVSRDDGLSWSEPREITPSVKPPDWTWYATGPGAGVQIERGPHRGRLVIPCDHIEAKTKRYYSHVIFSDDQGRTWRLGGTTPADQVNECEAAELADGALMLNMRSYDPTRKARQTAISRDGGATWTEQRIVPELVDPICQASLRRLTWPAHGKPGVLLFSNAASTRRERMTVRASLDDGATWPVARLISPLPAAYSCLAALPDGRIGLLYETGEKGPYERIVLAAFTLEWLRSKP
ncbi:MAG: sialidase family protein [Armatimonadetes bacterium]|nr:sialidase family protein [Armatimonadota bacterium]